MPRSAFAADRAPVFTATPSSASTGARAGFSTRSPSWDWTTRRWSASRPTTVRRRAAPAQGEQGASGSAGPLRGWKFTAYEGGFRVPAIFRWPGKIPAGRVCPELATTMDLLPTLAKLAGAKAPRDRTIDGKDIWPLLTRPKARSPHKLFCYYLDNQLQAVRSGRWKLILEQHEYPSLTTIMYTNRLQVMQKHFPLRDSPSLYDLETDVGEKHDVAAEHPAWSSG